MTLGSSDYRGGIAPIRTASELSALLPIPLLMIVEGYARPLFPASTPAHPSPYVAVVGTKPKKTYPPVVGLPLYIHWTQWESIVVPILEQKTLAWWRGQIQDLGDLLTLTNNVVGPSGEVVFPLGFQYGFSAWTEQSLGLLYACDPSDVDRVGGKSAEFLRSASGIVFRTASEAGY